MCQSSFYLTIWPYSLCIWWCFNVYIFTTFVNDATYWWDIWSLTQSWLVYHPHVPFVDVLFITWHSICSWCHCVPFVDADVHVHCVLPGVVNTNIYRHLPFRKSAFVAVSFAPFFWFLTKTPDDGAQTTLYALLGVSAGKTTGKIYK